MGRGGGDGLKGGGGDAGCCTSAMENEMEVTTPPILAKGAAVAESPPTDPPVNGAKDTGAHCGTTRQRAAWHAARGEAHLVGRPGGEGYGL